MAGRTSSHHMYALIGAQLRLAQIERERAAILKQFPGLKAAAGEVLSDIRSKRRMSAAARKAMSDGMRRFWARRKAAQKSG